MPRRSLLVLPLLALAWAGCKPRAAQPAGGVAWLSYEDGIAAAARDNKPVCLVLFTEWCPHCKNYRRVFEDPKVVELSQRFVMIRVDSDQQPQVSHQYAPDGEYVPRTFFLDSTGTLAPEIHAPRDRYRYFYDEQAPESVLGGMNAALARLTR